MSQNHAYNAKKDIYAKVVGTGSHVRKARTVIQKISRQIELVVKYVKRGIGVRVDPTKKGVRLVNMEICRICRTLNLRVKLAPKVFFAQVLHHWSNALLENITNSKNKPLTPVAFRVK